MTDPADESEDDDRDCVSELLAWLTVCIGVMVSRRDAENLDSFLVRLGWRRPT